MDPSPEARHDLTWADVASCLAKSRPVQCCSEIAETFAFSSQTTQPHASCNSASPRTAADETKHVLVKE